MTIFKRAAARRLALLGIVGLVAVGAFAASALAVVNGSPDNGRHPYVGVAVWFPTGNPADGFELCSGSLVSATVFVTAAHCFPEGATVFVDTDESGFADLHQPNFGHAVPGIAHPDPNWQLGAHGLAAADRNDIAVVQLAGAGLPQPGNRYAQLPALGSNNSLPANQPVEIVGYGIQTQSPLTFGTRFDAPAKVIPGGGSVGDEFLKISSSPGQGGATCNGDSGGPDLKAGTDLMLAISSYGASATCKAVDYSQRMDTAEALGFVSQYLND
jgi:secreted trypsin-like serine protease